MKISSVRPEVLALRKFYKEEAPYLHIPSIQRQFVWDSEDIKGLIDSIVNGYPIGSVIVWEPTAKFPSVPLVGDGNEKVKYILDGQQRLTALMLIKNGWQLTRGAKEIRTSRISFVPENEKLYVSEHKGIDVSLIVNATLGGADAIMKLHREYPTSYKKAMDIVGERIVNYELPFYVLKSDTKTSEEEEVYEQIAEIFTRVNSAGVKIGNLEMFLSFFAAAFPEKEKDKIISIHEEMSQDYELDLEPLVRFVFSKMGMNQNQITKVASFKKAIQDLKDRYSKEKHKISEILDGSRKSIRVVTELLDEEFGLSTTQYVPSQNVLLPLFDAVYEKGYESTEKISKPERRKMLRWFLTASFNGIYSSSPNYKIEDDMMAVRKSPKSFPLDELLSSMGSRPPRRNKIEKNDVIKDCTNVLRGRTGKEYLMLLDILLYLNKATDLAGALVKSEDAAVHHIFPREFLKESGETRDEMINCLANLTFISPSVNSEIGDTPPDEYLSQYDEEVLSQHLIPLDKKLWKIENYLKFLEERLKLIWKGTAELLDELKQ